MVEEFTRDSIWKDLVGAIAVPSNVRTQQGEGCSKEGMTKANQDVAMTKEGKDESSFSASTMSSQHIIPQKAKISSTVRDIYAHATRMERSPTQERHTTCHLQCITILCATPTMLVCIWKGTHTYCSMTKTNHPL